MNVTAKKNLISFEMHLPMWVFLLAYQFFSFKIEMELGL
jgi:hypothetical protein